MFLKYCKLNIFLFTIFKMPSRKNKRSPYKKSVRKSPYKKSVRKSYRKKSVRKSPRKSRSIRRLYPKFQVDRRLISSILDTQIPFGVRHSSQNYSDLISEYTKAIEMPLYYWRQFNDDVWNGEIRNVEEEMNYELEEERDEIDREEFPVQSIQVYKPDPATGQSYAPVGAQTLYFLRAVMHPGFRAIHPEIGFLGHYLVIANNERDAINYVRDIVDIEFELQTVDVIHSWKVVGNYRLRNGVLNIAEDL